MATLHGTLTANATTNIDIGDVATHHGVVVKYAATRGALYRAGQVTVLNKGATVDYSPDYFADAMGLTITADINGADIRLNCVVDNASATDITFNYNISRIDL